MIRLLNFFSRGVVWSIVCLSAHANTPEPPEIAVRSYLLLDVSANQVLAAKNIDVPLEPASLTKLMTAYVVFDALRSKGLSLTQTLPVSERAWKMPGSRMFLEPKMQVPVEDLIKGMIVQSGNDATIVLAQGVAGTVERFVQMMNEQAQMLGMDSTYYKNPEGLTEAGHVTTARDLGLLSMRLMENFPEYMGFYAIKRYHFPGTPPANDSNRNLLLFRDPSVDGLKTGHTDAAGYCVIATAQRAAPALANATSSGSRRLLAVVLGANSENSRANEAQKLLNWGFVEFDAMKLFDANQVVIAPNVWKGAASTVKIGRPQPIVLAVPRAGRARLTTQVVRAEPLIAPLAKGQVLATLKVRAGDQLLAEIPLLALDAVPQAGVLGRAWDALRMWLR